MSRPLVSIHDADTLETVVREMNDEEYADYLRLIEVTNARLEKEKTKLEAKNALLDKLGISDEEAKLLLS